LNTTHTSPLFVTTYLHISTAFSMYGISMVIARPEQG
jgi:hypothetical protein